MQCVDHRVARDEDLVFGHVFLQQILFAQRRGREVIRGDPPRDLTVHLLRPWTVYVVSPQPGFHMPDGDLLVKSRQRGRRGGRRVPVHEHDIGHGFGQHVPHPGQDPCRHIVKILPRLHDVQIEVGGDFKEIEHLIQHLAVLPRDTDYGFEFRRFRLKGFHQRSHLDRLRTGPEDQHDFFHRSNSLNDAAVGRGVSPPGGTSHVPPDSFTRSRIARYQRSRGRSVTGGASS